MNNDESNKPVLSRRGYPVERRFGKLLKRYAAYWVGVLITRALAEVPLAVCSWALSRFLAAWNMFPTKHRERSLTHMQQVFGPSRSKTWYNKTAKKMFMNLGLNLAEFLHIPAMPGSRLTNLVDGTDFRQKVASALSGGRGVICVTGHIGNWELLAAYCAKFFPTTVIAKRIYFEKFDREVDERRKRLGMELIYQEGGLRPIVQALKSNRVVGILADQDIPDAAGVFVNFMGKEAYTPVAPTALALANKTPLFVVCMERMENGRHRIKISDVEIPCSGDREKDRLELTHRWNEILVSSILERPEQWVWFHRRWRTRPSGSQGQNTRGSSSP